MPNGHRQRRWRRDYALGTHVWAKGRGRPWLRSEAPACASGISGEELPRNALEIRILPLVSGALHGILNGSA